MSEGSILPLFEHYDDHVDKTFNPPMITIATLFNRAVQNHPEKIFIKYYEYQFTYEEIGKLARTLAKNLTSNGLKKGSVLQYFYRISHSL
jgi:acyl-CoA synthetase (AMP-forming)/AMP-acid ligase II